MKINKLVLVTLILALMISTVQAAAPILKTVELIGEETQSGVNYYDADETPQFKITVNATANFSAVCDTVNTFTAAAACNENVTTGCVASSSYSSGTTKTISYTPTTTNTDYTIYCAACAKGAACDKTVITGANSVTFHVRQLKNNVTTIGSTIIIISMAIGAFFIMRKGGMDVGTTVKVLAGLLIAAILVIAMFNL